MVDPLSMYKSGAPIISVDGSAVRTSTEAQQQASIQSDTDLNVHTHIHVVPHTISEQKIHHRDPRQKKCVDMSSRKQNRMEECRRRIRTLNQNEKLKNSDYKLYSMQIRQTAVTEWLGRMNTVQWCANSHIVRCVLKKKQRFDRHEQLCLCKCSNGPSLHCLPHA